MAFRANEAAQQTWEQTQNYLIARELNETQRARSRVALEEIVKELGPAVDHYPSWHPLVSNYDSEDPIIAPGNQCGYRGLDHTCHFVNGFITCPYSDGEDILDSVRELPYDGLVHVSAERLDVKFYHPDATAIVVKCQWGRTLSRDGTIPLSIALPLMLEKEIAPWRSAKVAETWESMRPYLLGAPHGSRSSLFVNQTTGQGLKKVWNLLITSGMFGPVRE